MKGILLVNLGTPTEATPTAVRRYLAEFLDDPRVIDLPNIVRKILLYGVILPFRPKKTAKAYAKIFDPEKGSPLLYHSQALADGLQAELGEEYAVELGMRYGVPRLTEAIENLYQRGCDEITAIPLFAQYSSAVNGSVIEAICKIVQKKVTIPSLRWISEFYRMEGFLTAQAAKIQETLSTVSPKDTGVIFSYHSLPVRQIRKSSQHCAVACFQDAPCGAITLENQACYRAKCFETSRELIKRLGLSEGKTVFQSKLGRTAWIGPDFNEGMKNYRAQGIKNIVVVCPSFIVDCLETLEEIGIRGKEEWHRLGGSIFELVPALNADPHWIKALSLLFFKR
jgi:protoporphyrin/coproporphyrin ferrochelatase